MNKMYLLIQQCCDRTIQLRLKCECDRPRAPIGCEHPDSQHLPAQSRQSLTSLMSWTAKPETLTSKAGLSGRSLPSQPNSLKSNSVVTLTALD
jgi:hypothetical protein